MKIYPVEDFLVNVIKVPAKDVIEVTVQGPNFKYKKAHTGVELFMKGISPDSLVKNHDSVLRAVYYNTYKAFIKDREDAIGLYTGKANNSGPVQVPTRWYQKNKSTCYCVRRVRPVKRAFP